jgi:prepilin-type N-terminal cleavage/methylation domain-containing protein
MRNGADRGFSFVEVLLALTIVLAATAPLLHVAASGQRLSRSHGEAADLHQRVRVAVETLRADLTLAGAGGLEGPVSDVSGSLAG